MTFLDRFTLFTMCMLGQKKENKFSRCGHWNPLVSTQIKKNCKQNTEQNAVAAFHWEINLPGYILVENMFDVYKFCLS